MTMIQHLRSIALPFILTLLAAAPVTAQYPAEPGNGIADLAGIIAPADAERIQAAIQALQRDPGVDVRVLTVQGIARHDPAATPEQFATSVYNRWRVGAGHPLDGVLVLVSMDDRFARIELGDGVPAHQDARMRDVVDGVMIPRIREGQASAALREGVLSIAAAFGAPAAEAAPPPVQAPVPLAEPVPTLPSSYDNPNDEFALSGGALLLILLAGAGVAAAGAYLYQRSVQNRCTRCGGTLVRLDGRAAAAHLDAGQQMEEELGSVSHAVWRCTGCGAHDVRHDPKLSEWDRCRECGYRTVRTTTSVVREPTAEYDGGEQVTATCACCGWSRVDVVRQPARRPVRVPEDRDRWREDETTWTRDDDSGSSGSGGGRSSGRGASGRW
ncbi:MAG TPA: TPM domain-containing protein [Longimicrobium sp.]|nr:TPM domain-containing protein [Longimicrobium sp.]